MMSLPSAAAYCLLALAEGRMGISGTQENNASAGQCVLPTHTLLPCLPLPAGRSAFLADMSVLQMGFFKSCNRWRYHICGLKIQSHPTQTHTCYWTKFFKLPPFLSEKDIFMRKPYGTICLLDNSNEFQGNPGFHIDINLEFSKWNSLNFQVSWIIQINFSSEFDLNFFWPSIF